MVVKASKGQEEEGDGTSWQRFLPDKFSILSSVWELPTGSKGMVGREV